VGDSNPARDTVAIVEPFSFQQPFEAVEPIGTADAALTEEPRVFITFLKFASRFCCYARGRRLLSRRSERGGLERRMWSATVWKSLPTL
jgi:hypothetical protein